MHGENFLDKTNPFQFIATLINYQCDNAYPLIENQAETAEMLGALSLELDLIKPDGLDITM